MAKNVLTWVLVAFLVYFVARRPDTAADVVRSLGSGLMVIGQGFGDFFVNLTGT
jgi:hypothetical protein